MTTHSQQLLALRPNDIATFLAVARYSTLSDTARELGVTPSQISKALRRLEHILGQELIERRGRVIALSGAGEALLPRFKDIIARLECLASPESKHHPNLTLVSTALLSSILVPRIARAHPELQLRSIELPPGVIAAYATEGLYDVALAMDGPGWPKTWSKTYVGKLVSGLFASPRRARQLAPAPIPSRRLHGATFVMPAYSFHGQLVRGDDRCPLELKRRRVGAETQTAAMGLELAQFNDQLIFVPKLAALPFVKRGTLVELPVRTWQVYDDLYLFCHPDRVRARVQRDLTATLKAALHWSQDSPSEG